MTAEKWCAQNSTNAKGLIPLHMVCRRDEENYSTEPFFNIIDGIQQTVQVDTRDNQGRTPLQLNVANLLLDTCDVLLDHDADMSSFVFPTASYFGDKIIIWSSCGTHYFKLIIASRDLIVVERLVRKGYELDRSDTLTIMTFFAEFGWKSQCIFTNVGMTTWSLQEVRKK
uniref:Uncharacterized protein n=1 Tax=Trichogramma kaykai TaxID=54128 RepID=A0ABD2WAH4_9HYME